MEIRTPWSATSRWTVNKYSLYQRLCFPRMVILMLDLHEFSSVYFDFVFIRYIIIMSFFHFSEFLVTSIIRPQTLSTDSFLLNHSTAYKLAALVSWVEYFIESYYFPG